MNTESDTDSHPGDVQENVKPETQPVREPWAESQENFILPMGLAFHLAAQEMQSKHLSPEAFTTKNDLVTLPTLAGADLFCDENSYPQLPACTPSLPSLPLPTLSTSDSICHTNAVMRVLKNSIQKVESPVSLVSENLVETKEPMPSTADIEKPEVHSEENDFDHHLNSLASFFDSSDDEQEELPEEKNEDVLSKMAQVLSLEAPNMEYRIKALHESKFKLLNIVEFLCGNITNLEEKKKLIDSIRAAIIQKYQETIVNTTQSMFFLIHLHEFENEMRAIMYKMKQKHVDDCYKQTENNQQKKSRCNLVIPLLFSFGFGVICNWVLDNTSISLDLSNLFCT